jgi:hypothetical protein
MGEFLIKFVIKSKPNEQEQDPQLTSVALNR